MLDLTIICYQIGQYIVLYNFILFTIWLLMVKHEGGKVSEIYLIVMALFATRFFGIFVGMQARKLVESYDDFFDFTHTLIWHLRLLPEAIVFLILAVVLTKRFVKSYLFKDPQYTRKNGNRKTDK